MIEGASINDRGNLKLAFIAPKLVRDRYIGPYLDWDKSFEICAQDLLYYELLGPNFRDTEIDDYTAAVRRGLKIAKRL